MPSPTAGPLDLAPFHALRLSGPRVGDPRLMRLLARPRDRDHRVVEGWIRRGLAVRDETASLHLHEYGAGRSRVRGLVGALDISRTATPGGAAAVLPHERVQDRQTRDLASRLVTTTLDPAPLLLVQRSPAALRALLRQVREQPPTHQFLDRHGQTHRLWPLERADLVAEASGLLAPTTAVLADGHHRYAAHQLRLASSSETDGRALAMVIDQDDLPLRIGAIHRVLGGTRLDEVVRAARTTGFTTEDADETSAPAFLEDDWLVLADGRQAVAVRHPTDQVPSRSLHDRLLPAIEGRPRILGHEHDVDQAVARARASAGVATLLPRPSLASIEQAVASGNGLPEKTTWFSPKPTPGAVLRQVRVAVDAPS